MDFLLNTLLYAPLQRLYKFVLKKLLGRFLKRGDLDLDQFDVQLSDGVLELRDVELNTEVFI
jgi:hypothetical protein